MLPISEEKITRIEDFIHQMTDEQVTEWYKEFKKRQYNLSHYFQFSIDIFPDPKAKDIAKREFIFLIKCFESYKVTIPLILGKELKFWGIEWQKVTDRITTEENYAYKLFQVGDDISQLPLTKHLVHKYILDKEMSKLFPNDFLGAYVSVLMLYVWGISRKMEKLVGNSITEEVDDFPLISKETIRKVVDNYNLIKEEDLPDYLSKLTDRRSDLSSYCPELKTPNLSNPYISMYFFLYTIIYNSYEMQYGKLPLMLSDIVNEVIKKSLHEGIRDLRNKTNDKIVAQLRKNSKQIHLMDFIYKHVKEQEFTIFKGDDMAQIQMGMYGIADVLEHTARKKFKSFACIENPYHVLINQETIDFVNNTLEFMNEKEKLTYFDKVFEPQKPILVYSSTFGHPNSDKDILTIVLTNLTAFFLHCFEHQMSPRSEISPEIVTNYIQEWMDVMTDYTGTGDKTDLHEVIIDKLKQPALVAQLNEIIDGTVEMYNITDETTISRSKFFLMMILDIINNQPAIIQKKDIN